MSLELNLNNDGRIRLQACNPWIFRRDLKNPEIGEATTDLVPAVSPDGEILGWGFLTPEVDTVARILQPGAKKPDPIELFGERLEKAAIIRARMLDPGLQAFRLVNSEGDFLPGLVVERYGKVIYVESPLGFWRHQEEILRDQIIRMFPDTEVLFSWSPSLNPPGCLTISEYGLQFEMAIGKGQKTGHYCDQRENRNLLGRVFEGGSVLDLFSYSGGFSLAVGKKANRITAVDRSAPALDLLRRNAELNHIDSVEIIRSDADAFFQNHKNEAFDAVICDPPKLVKRRAEKQSGLRMYFRLNLQALSCVRAGGLMMTFSCSGSVSAEELRGTVAAAARKLGRSIQVLALLSAGPDHPALLSLPETAYLKGLLLKIA